MLDLATERKVLVKADLDLAEGQERILRQTALIERLRRAGHGVNDAEALLETLKQTQEAWRRHREEIVRTIARLEAESPRSSEVHEPPHS